MKNKILLNTFRTIKKNFPRFLVLLLISFLGAFTFVGLESTSTSMNKSLDKYMDDGSNYDIEIISSLGLTNKDIEKLNDIKGINHIEGSYSRDVIISLNNEEYVLNISSITENINTLNLVEGRMPLKENEIVVEENLLKINNINLGDSIKVNDLKLKYNELEIVGTVSSTLYFNATTFFQYRGSSNIGTGQVNYFSFGVSSLFNIDYYSSIYITIDDLKDSIATENKYLEKVEEIKNQIDKIKDQCIKERINILRKQLEVTKGFLDVFVLSYQNNINQNKNQYNQILKDLQIEDGNFENKVNELKDEILSLELLLNDLDNNDPNYDQYQLELNLLKDLLSQYNKLIQLQDDIQKEEKLLIEYKKASDKSIKEMERMLNNENANWFILDRLSNKTYLNYIDYSESMSNIAKVFSTIFLSLSILISMVSMNRIIEDDRQEIGTLKSLGFSNATIRIKYLLFGLSATLIGGIIGTLLGPLIISKFIFKIFSQLFVLPKYYLIYDIIKILIGILSLLLIVLGVTYLTINKVVKEKPAELVRVKGPSKGTRVFLEKIKFIWTKLNFTNKVTIRNLFRYKKRAIVTILGVAGCSAILMSGFGIRNSFSEIPERQIGEIFKFDALVYVNNYDIENEEIFINDKIVSKTNTHSFNVTVNNINAKLIAFEDDSKIDNFVSLKDHKTSEIRTIEDNKIIISQKLAKLENVEVGDYLEFVDSNNYNYKVQISAIVEHYFEHYIYMNKATYETFGESFVPNLMLINTIELNEQEKEEFKKELLNNNAIFNVSYINEILDSAQTIINLLNKVIIIVIVLASILSFVVLYNLSSINIYERKRELATLKVLGFHNKEIDRYINKESLILTIIGILIGFGIGVPITLLIINLIEIDKLFFFKEIKFMTYLFSGSLTILFAIVINYVSHFILKKINMIDSLKSVE